MSLPIEKQFTIATFNNNVDRMSEQQAKELLKPLHVQYISQQVAYNELIKKQWFPELTNGTNQRQATGEQPAT